MVTPSIRRIQTYAASLVLAFFITCMPTIGIAVGDQLRPPPITPTEDDCAAYSREFHAILTEMQMKLSQCMTSSVFGMVTTCNGRTLSAYSQCASLDLQKCQFERNSRPLIDACFAKARELAAQDRRSLEKLRATVKLYENWKNYYDQGKAIVEHISDPKKFLWKELSRYPNASAQVFGTTDQQFDATLGQDIYRYVHAGANAGLEKTLHPLIRRIQIDALAHIGQVHKQSLGELDRLNGKLQSFEVISPTTSDPGLTEGQGSHNPDQQLCKILETC